MVKPQVAAWQNQLAEKVQEQGSVFYDIVTNQVNICRL